MDECQAICICHNCHVRVHVGRPSVTRQDLMHVGCPGRLIARKMRETSLFQCARPESTCHLARSEASPLRCWCPNERRAQRDRYNGHIRPSCCPSLRRKSIRPSARSREGLLRSSELLEPRAGIFVIAVRPRHGLAIADFLEVGLVFSIGNAVDRRSVRLCEEAGGGRCQMLVNCTLAIEEPGSNNWPFEKAMQGQQMANCGRHVAY